MGTQQLPSAAVLGGHVVVCYEPPTDDLNSEAAWRWVILANRRARGDG
jgi:hypothetical protein